MQKLSVGPFCIIQAEKDFDNEITRNTHTQTREDSMTMSKHKHKFLPL
jgi:hypothetical protein